MRAATGSFSDFQPIYADSGSIICSPQQYAITLVGYLTPIPTS